MDKKFLYTLSQTHSTSTSTASTLKQAEQWSNELFEILFNSQTNQHRGQGQNEREANVREIEKSFEASMRRLGAMLEGLGVGGREKEFYGVVGDVYGLLRQDIKARFPSQQPNLPINQLTSVYPQFRYIYLHRLSHQLHKLSIPKLPSILTQLLYKHRVYINQTAKIGGGFVLCCGVNTQIGSGAIIGKNVKIYDSVVLGQLEGEKDGYPTIEDDVVVYSGAVVLGGRTVVGRGSVIGRGVFVGESVLPDSKMFNNPERTLVNKNDKDRFSIQSLIGNTPLVQIKNIFKHPKVKIYGKLQGQNPGGSVKDRPAYNMIKQALRRGQIGPGIKLIEPTSGNTGIALAMIACIFNLDIELVMPENSTAERVQTMEAYGAKVILTPAATGIQGSRDYAEEQVAKGGYKMLNQFANHDNYMAHYYSTGPQVWRDTNGQITHFVSSMGTTGTIMGTSRYLKQKNNQIQIVGVQPTEGAKIPGIRRWAPEYLPKIFQDERVDQKIDVSEQQSLTMMRRMAKEEGIFAGMSSGGAMAAAVRLAKTLKEGVIVTIVCDRGDRYLSSGIFAS